MGKKKSAFIYFFSPKGFSRETMMYCDDCGSSLFLNDSVLGFVIYFLTVWELKVTFDVVWEINFQTVNYKNTFNQSQTFMKSFIEVFFH